MKKKLIKEYLIGKASEEEQQQVLAYLRQSKENVAKFDALKEDWKNSNDKFISLKAIQSWEKLHNKINPQILIGKKWMISISSVAASILIVVGIFLYTTTSKLNSQFVSIHTESGQLTEVYLPDSTRVFINSESNILYKTKMLGLKREVFLNGEAFFDVSKRKFSTFDVYADNVNIHVTGTRFNVKSYQGEDISVVLEEGSIEVGYKQNPDFKTKMKPGERMVYNQSTGKLKRSKINVTDFTKWKEGILYFENNKLPDLLKVLERRYGVQFAEITDPLLMNLTFTFTIRNESFEKVMQVMASALPIKVETENQIINIELDQEKYQKIK